MEGAQDVGAANMTASQDGPSEERTAQGAEETVPSAPRRTTVHDWIEGARLRTLPLGIASVLLGTGTAAAAHGADPLLAILALLLALSLQIGVNFANDYSDGIRGTDRYRVGPARLTGGGLARPSSVLKVAIGFFMLAAIAGFSLVFISGTWWLLAVGVAAIAAAWFYTGGKRPYGYAGLGEAAVFVFFGLVATLGTAYVQLGSVTALSAWAAVAAGSYACGVLMINNIRDIASDQSSGKRTLAVRLGAPRARMVFLLFVLIPYFLLVPMGTLEPWSILALASLPVAGMAVRTAFRPCSPKDLVLSLKLTSIGTLLYAALASFGWWVGI